MASSTGGRLRGGYERHALERDCPRDLAAGLMCSNSSLANEHQISLGERSETMVYGFASLLAPPSVGPPSVYLGLKKPFGQGRDVAYWLRVLKKSFEGLGRS